MDILDYIKAGFQQTVRENREDHGIFHGLPYPYTVPGIGGELDAYYYWDIFFTNKGLLRCGMEQQAIWNVENHLHQVERWGYVPNINHAYGIKRSQQPYLLFMVADILDFLPHPEDFLQRHWSSLVTEYNHWQKRRQTPCGLNRNYHDVAEGWLDGYYDYLRSTRFPGLRHDSLQQRRAFASERLAEGEIWDFTPRFLGRCSAFATVDLNANLYGYEGQFAEWAGYLHPDEADTWKERAQSRLEQMNRFLWNEAIGAFGDYDFVRKEQSPVVSAGMLNPLFFGVATASQAARIRDLVCNKLEYPHGISTCVEAADGWTYQWDHPNGWPPIQLLAVEGLRRYGYDEDARRIARKYIDVVENNYASTGKIWEKYNVESGQLDVSSEYALPEMFGWTSGVYLALADSSS